MSELRKHFWVLFLLSFVVFQPIFAENSGSISGKVTSEKSRRGIPDVKVVISNDYHYSDAQTIKTDKNGIYLFNNLHPGVYRIYCFIEHPYYYFDWKNNTVNVNPGKKSVFNIKLKLGGSISGKLYNIDGHTPLSEIRISTILDNFDIDCKTKDDGSFFIGGLKPSKIYKIGIGFQGDYTFPDNIVVDRGKETKVKDIIFDIREVTKIKGCVKSFYDGGPIQDAKIELNKKQPNGDYTYLARLVSGQKGEFEFTRLDPGEYSYRVIPPLPYKNKLTGEHIVPANFLVQISDHGKIKLENGKQKFLNVALRIPSDSMSYKTDVEVRFKYEGILDKKPNGFHFECIEPGITLFRGAKVLENQLTYKLSGIPPGEYELNFDFPKNGLSSSTIRSGFLGGQNEIIIPWDYRVIIDVALSGEKADEKDRRYNSVNQSTSYLIDIIRNRKEKTVYYKMEVIRKWYQE